jgi:signal transduction histidine kinase/DNA-binding response OmpR family regulator
MRFGTRLAVFLAVSLIGVQSLTVAVGYAVSREKLVENGNIALAKAASLFGRQLDLVSQRVGDSAEVLALDFPLRKAVADQDLRTVASVLSNHGERIGAKRMFLVGLDGNIRVDTAVGTDLNHPFPFAGLLDASAADGLAAGKAVTDGKLVWLIAVPVRAPTPIGYVVASVPIDASLIGDLSELSALPTSISLVTDGGRALAQALKPHAGEPDHLTSKIKLDTLPGSTPVYAVFEYPMADALRPYDAVMVPLLAVFLVGLAIAVMGAVVVAHRVARPLVNLAKSAQKIEAGDYTPPPPVEGTSEVAHLSNALAAMARAIGDRSAELEMSRDAAWRANAAKSDFLANMSHEIRTPLNAVLGLAGVLIDTPLTDEQHRHVVLIKQSGDNLLSILNDILDLSKLDAGKIELENFAFDAAALTTSSLDLLRQRATEKGLALKFEEQELLPVVIGDPSRIRQVLLNLVGNAIKFTAAGRVGVRVAAVERGGGSVTLEWSVSDNGIGMSADQLRGLFKEFSQADSSISRRFGGTGLGLAICKRLVERMGGTIRAASVEGQGSVFSFRLPFKTGDRSMLAPPTPSAGHDLAAAVAKLTRTVRILVVEDNITNQIVARNILKMDGVHVDVACNGREAVDAVMRHPYDLVFMDVQMPVLDGLSATREIRANGGSRLAALPIIAFSANAYASDVDACLKAGMNGHVAKPVQKETLRAAVVQALSGVFTTAARQPSEAVQGDAPDYDAACVDALIESLTLNIVQDLLTSFVKDTHARIDRLPALLTEYEKLTIEVHTMKSAGAQVGAMRLSRLAADLERRALDRETVTTQDVSQLKTALDGFETGLATRVQASR